VFRVVTQGEYPISPHDVFAGERILIEELPNCLKNFLERYVNTEYKKIISSNGQKNTIVTINNTRISTFFSFTDGQKLLVLDRANSPDVTTVINRNYDVFGSVGFENYSIFKKIENKDFFKCMPTNIKAIPGFVFEDNVDSNSKAETVIMFGYHVFMESEDLLKGVNSPPRDSIVTTFDVPEERPRAQLQLTAKARHAIDSLVDLKKVHADTRGKFPR
jgi:hypothetical protein